MKRKRQSKGPYVGIPKAIMATPAWRAMTPEARLLWIELRGWLRNDGLNNGKVRLSCRDGADAIGLHKDTIAHRFVKLEHFGFLRKTAEGFLGSDGRGIAAKYRFTDLAYGTHPPTRDFEKWDRTPFVYLPRRPGRKKQKPVLSRRTPCPTAQDIRKAGNGGAVCPTAQDIRAVPRCPTAPDISRLPSPAVGQRGKDKDQGSSTARAPVQAGDAGSSPAPDAKADDSSRTPLQGAPAAPPAATNGASAQRREELMAYVANVTEEQPKQLDQGALAPVQAAPDVKPDQPVPAPNPEPVPPRPMLPRDRQREEQRRRNLEALLRNDPVARKVFEAQIRGPVH